MSGGDVGVAGGGGTATSNDAGSVGGGRGLGSARVAGVHLAFGPCGDGGAKAGSEEAKGQ